MPDISSVPVKEAVEIIEARLPGGKVLTRIILGLVVLVVVVWAIRFLWDAIHPIAQLGAALVAGKTFSVSLSNVLEWFVILLFCIAAWYLSNKFKNLLREYLTQTKQQMDQHAEGCLKISKECVDSESKVIQIADDLQKLVLRVQEKLLEFDQRLHALETKHD